MDNAALTRDQAERYRIALDRHRADLLEWGAAEAQAGGKVNVAAIKTRQAEYLRAMADWLEEFRSEVVFADDGHKGSKANKRRLGDFQTRRREIRARFADVTGGAGVSVGGAEIRFDFPEPTPAELGLEF